MHLLRRARLRGNYTSWSSHNHKKSNSPFCHINIILLKFQLETLFVVEREEREKKKLFFKKISDKVNKYGSAREKFLSLFFLV